MAKPVDAITEAELAIIVVAVSFAGILEEAGVADRARILSRMREARIALEQAGYQRAERVLKSIETGLAQKLTLADVLPFTRPKGDDD